MPRLAEVGQSVKGSPLDRTRAFYRAVREHQATNLFDDDLTFMVAERAAGD